MKTIEEMRENIEDNEELYHGKVYAILHSIASKYVPWKGCENCWGDTHLGCTDECLRNQQVQESFIDELKSLITLDRKERDEEVRAKLQEYRDMIYGTIHKQYDREETIEALQEDLDSVLAFLSNRDKKKEAI